MDIVVKGKLNDHKKGLITKTWKRCRSFSGRANQTGTVPRQRLPRKSQTWHDFNNLEPVSQPHHKDSKHKCWVAPEGCFSVYVGPDKQRFVVKAKYANHPLFMALLEEAESEYGYNCVGPIELPCDVNVFFRVLMEMDNDDGVGGTRSGCGFPIAGRVY